MIGQMRLDDWVEKSEKKNDQDYVDAAKFTSVRIAGFG